MQYHGVLFDYDGTLTPRYENDIPEDLLKKVIDLNTKGVMMGICTARSFKSAVPKLDPFLEMAKSIGGLELSNLVRNKWVLICENGSKGYKFDEGKNDYLEFYSTKWPEQISRQELFDALMKEFNSNSEIINNDISFELYHKEDLGPDVEQNDVSFILRPTGRLKMTHSDWEIASAALYKRVMEFLKAFLPACVADISKLLHIGDSKMGVSILPANGDKDRGIQEFAALVSSINGTRISEPFREIIAVGDQAVLGGNDYYFLKGEIGTTFNVGEENEPSSLSKRAIDDSGMPLIGPIGTLKILENLFN